MIDSIFYLLSCIILIAGFFWFPRSKEKANGMLWLIVCIVFYECWVTFAGGLLSLIHIPVSLVTMGIANFILVGALFLLYQTQATGIVTASPLKTVISARQRFSFSLVDIAFAVALIIFLVYVWQERFAQDAAIIYATIDPVDRFSRAVGILAEKTVIGPYPNLYFTHITNALFMGLAEPVFSGAYMVRAFEIKELINVWIAGMLFYNALRQFSDKPFAKVISFVLAFAYTLGFPWNNELWGFGYLGVSVSLIILVQIGVKFLRDDRQKPVVGLVLISAGCLGVGLTYTMFAPPVFIAAFIAIGLWKKRRFILTEIFVFAIPVLFTFVYTVVIGRGDAGSDLGDQFMAEGAIYRNLFGDFLIWLPLCLFAIVFAISKKEWDFSRIFAIIFAIFQAYFLYRMIEGTVSTYYYYKLNFATWFIVLFLAGIAIILLTENRSRKAMAMAACYLAVFFAVGLFTVRGYDSSLTNRGEFINPIYAADGLFAVYMNNNAYFKELPGNAVYYNWDFIRLCEAARVARSSHPDAGTADDFYVNRIETVSTSFRDAYWVDALTGEHIDQQPVSGITELPNSDAEIFVVLTNSELYKENAAEIDTWERVFENDLGFVALSPGAEVSE